MPTQKPEKIRIDNPKYKLSQGGSFPFNQASARGFTFQHSTDPNFMKKEEKPKMADLIREMKEKQHRYDYMRTKQSPAIYAKELADLNTRVNSSLSNRKSSNR